MNLQTSCKYVDIVPGGVKLFVRLSPKAKREGFEGIYVEPNGEERLKIAVTAPPIDGKANEAVIKLISKKVKIAKSLIHLIIGETDRNKIFFIEGNIEQIISALQGEEN
ncbi:MAG: DUF167 family protein [Alphaproteobacteria bacterium]|nr:DUF167 family protein [Alphaproteobacteria bacterium]